MHVGVLGGGLQGCCVAIALAERGARVTLFDRNPTLLSRTAVANEGKIHLGYMYAGDPTLSTAKTMMRGALAFTDFFRRHLGDAWRVETSAPASYALHRGSQHDLGEVSRYLAAVHDLIAEAAAAGAGSYFDADLSAPLRPWSRAECEARFDAGHVVAAFDSPEVAINPVGLGDVVRAAVTAHPRIEAIVRRTVNAVDIVGDRVDVASAGDDGTFRDGFDHVVNALWEGRLAIDRTAGFAPGRPWLHRLKYGVSFRLPPGAETPPSATFISGPFGEVVSYPGGLTYLTWYPTCMRALSRDIAPPDWPTYPEEPVRSEIIAGTHRALAEIVPSLRPLDPAGLPEAIVKGGVILAWGATDIYDPVSELHRRYEIGVTSNGRYHSVDPGKLTLAPYFAEKLAERLAPRPSAGGS